jgi:hypothetical protein
LLFNTIERRARRLLLEDSTVFHREQQRLSAGQYVRGAKPKPSFGEESMRESSAALHEVRGHQQQDAALVHCV